MTSFSFFFTALLSYLPDAGLGQSAGTPFLDGSWLEVSKCDGVELFVVGGRSDKKVTEKRRTNCCRMSEAPCVFWRSARSSSHRGEMSTRN